MASAGTLDLGLEASDMGTSMKALSLWQPWASLVALGVKTIETRSWRTSYRGPLAIHATALLPKAGVKVGDYRVSHARSPRDAPWQLWPEAKHLRRSAVTMPLGAVIATCTLVDVLPIHEQLCKCGTRAGNYVSRGVGGLGREVLGLYRPDGLAISYVNFNQTEHPWIDARGYAGSEAMIEELSYGDYRCGRWAWLLNNIEPLAEPVPARGHQQLWNWNGG